jgi:ABC-type molybdate transport system substrate-binding protein
MSLIMFFQHIYIKDNEKLAIGEVKTVPAGKYAKQYLDNQHLYSDVNCFAYLPAGTVFTSPIANFSLSFKSFTEA